MLEERIKRKNSRMNNNSREDKKSNKSNLETNKLIKENRVFQKGFTPNPNGVKNNEGRLLTGNQQVLERLREYFCELLNVKERDPILDQNDESTLYYVQLNVEPPTKEEVKNVVKALNNNKALG